MPAFLLHQSSVASTYKCRIIRCVDDLFGYIVGLTRHKVESINNWISSICKDYPDSILLGAMHPEFPYSKAMILWMQQSGIKRLKLRS